MKLLLVETAPYGGLLHYTVQLGTALAERGHEVDLLTAKDNEMAERDVGAAHMWDVLPPPVLSSAPAPTGRVQSLVRRVGIGFRLARAWLRILLESRRGNYDVVIIDSAFDVSIAAIGMAALTRLPGGPRVADLCHNVRVFNRWSGKRTFGGSPFIHWLVSRIYKSVDIVFVHGERSREEFEEAFPDRRVAIIPHGDERVFTDEPPPPAPGEHILFFGHWNRVKGIPVLMDAFDLLASRRPDATLTLAGAPNPQEIDVEQIRAWAGGHGQRVELIDRYIPLDEVESIFARARVVVTPYTAGYQSGIIHLAMTMERAVVTADVGDLGSAVVDGETGLVVKPGDPDELADALVQVISDKGLAARFGAAGRGRVMGESPWEKVAEYVERALEGSG